MIFSADSVWRRRIDQAPVSPHSDRLLAYMSALGSETGGPAHLVANWGKDHVAEQSTPPKHGYIIAGEH